jgi:hypothetical protein
MGDRSPFTNCTMASIWLALLDLAMKRFLETLSIRSEFSEIIAPLCNAIWFAIAASPYPC